MVAKVSKLKGLIIKVIGSSFIISIAIKIPINKISIKATTNEKIGMIGKGEGIAAESIVQIIND